MQDAPRSFPPSASLSARPIILWDIDATLIRQSSFKAILIEAAIECWGIPAPAPGSVTHLIAGSTGKTDGQLVGELLQACGASPSQIGDAAIQAALRHYEHRLAAACRWGSNTLALPGIEAALSRLRCLGFTQALLTTCTSQAASIKLRSAGLEGYFSEDGALKGTFCTARQGRDQIMRQARATYGSAPLVYIADSVLDMHSGRSIGATCIAVRSGAVSAEDLTAAGARQVITSRAQLECIDRVLELAQGGDLGRHTHPQGSADVASPRASRAGIRLDLEDFIDTIDPGAHRAIAREAAEAIDSSLPMMEAALSVRPRSFGSWLFARR